MKLIRFFSAACIMLLLIAAGAAGTAYSLLTHEQLIDLAWKDSIVPLLLSRYPTLTPAQLDEAHALRLWRLRHPGHRLLPFRRRVLL